MSLRYEDKINELKEKVTHLKEAFPKASVDTILLTAQLMEIREELDSLQGYVRSILGQIDRGR